MGRLSLRLQLRPPLKHLLWDGLRICRKGLHLATYCGIGLRICGKGLHVAIAMAFSNQLPRKTLSQLLYTAALEASADARAQGIGKAQRKELIDKPKIELGSNLRSRKRDPLKQCRSQGGVHRRRHHQNAGNCDSGSSHNC